jgi:hypothetical protein
MSRVLLASLFALLLGTTGAAAQACYAIPNMLTNGTTADATAVMSNFNYLLNCGNALHGFLGGMTLSNDSMNANTVIDTAAGAAESSDGVALMPLNAFTKNANAAWAVGTGNGCLSGASGLSPTTWYHLFVIERTDTGVVDEICSTTIPASLPSGYTEQRRIGSFKTDASAHILQFSQVGDVFYWASPPVDIQSFSPGPTAANFQLSTPLGVATEAIVGLSIQTGTSVTNDSALLSSLAVGDTAPGYLGPNSVSDLNNVANSVVGTQLQVMTNTASTIRGRMQNGGANSAIFVTTFGWRDFLGR